MALLRPTRARRVTRSAAGRIVMVATMVVLAITFAAGHSTVHAADGARLSSSTVFRLDTERPAVVVESTYTMTNVSPDRDLGGGRFEYFFFTGLSVSVDSTATEIDVEINGRDGDFDIVSEDGFTLLDIRLGYELRYQKTATIVVSSVLLGDPPRSEDSFVRVNPAYASFPVFAWADDGRADVRIEVPDTWTPEYIGDDLTERVEGGLAVFEATGIDSPTDWGVLFTARDDDALESTRVTAGGADFEIRSWPGDDEWRTFVSDHIVDGLPALESLTGTPWPEPEKTDVIEASTPYLRGYAGFYNAFDDVIEVGEDLDSHTLLHELTHAWFNWTLISDRWISEGLAEEVSARALAALGDELPEPRTDDDLRALDIEVAPFPLNEWGDPADALDDPREDYGYAASFRVMRALWDEVGSTRMDDLLAAVIAGERAYPGEGEPELDTSAVDWQEFLDLAEQIGRSEQVDDLYVEFVLTASQIDELERRDAVVEEYDALAERGGTWTPPAGLRRAMAEWQLGSASDQIANANDTLDLRDRLAAALEPIGLSPGDEIESIYEDTGLDLSTVDDELGRRVDAATALSAARRDLQSTLEPLGLDMPPLTQAGYERDPVGVADTTATLLTDAEVLADRSERLDGVLARHDLSVPELEADAFVVDSSAALRTLDAQLAAAEAVAAAHDARDAADSLVERLGLLGSDIGTAVEQMDAALAAGDTEQAVADAGAVVDTVDDLDRRGTMMLAVLGAGLTLLLAAGLAAMVVRRRRRTPAIAATPSPTPGTTVDPVDGPVDGSGLQPPDSMDAIAGDAPDQAHAGEAGSLDPDR